MLPDIIIIADSKGESLRPLTDHTCQAMLSVAGKPIIEHILESISALEHRKVHIVASSFVTQIESFVGQGERWGCNVDVLVSRGDTNWDRILNKHTSAFSDACIIVDCKALRDFRLDRVVNALKDTGQHSCCAVNFNKVLGISYHRRLPDGQFQTENASTKEIEIDIDDYHRVTTLRDYYDANINLLKSNDRQELTYRGKEEGMGLTTGAGTNISQSSIKYGSVLAGTCTTAHKSCRFSGTVVLGNEVVVDRNSDITDSVILDNSYVGSHLSIDKAIVWRNTLISIESGSVIELDDPFLLSTVGESSSHNHFHSIVNQLLGLIALVVSIPLWCAALLLSSLQSPDTLMSKKRLVGNIYVGGRRINKPYNQYFFNSRYRLINQLPLLLSIATGRIRWFGVSLCTQTQLSKRQEAWEFVRDQHPVGLIGPAQWQYGPGYDNRSIKKSGLSSYFLADALYSEFSFSEALFSQRKNLDSGRQFRYH